MDLTWVSATAIVKARDGSSIADWDESSGIPADHYLADPDRIKAAMRAVEDAGLTAGPVGDCTVSFSGTADQVSALFGTALDTTRPDSPAWAGGDDVLTLPTSQSLAPQLESIRLARVASHLGGRTYGAEYLPSSDVLDTDLLVGEVGQTLRASAPPRLERWGAFPTSTVDQATRDSITQWKEGRPARSHPLPGPGGTFLGWNTGERRRTRLGVLEISGGSTVVQGLLTEFGLTPEVSSELTSGSRFEDLSVYYEYPDLWKKYVSSMARRVIELGDRLEDAKRHAVAVRDSLEAGKRPAVAVRDNPSSPLAGNAISKLVEALDGIRTNIDSLKESGGVYLKSGMKDPALDFVTLDTGPIKVAATAFRALNPKDAGAADSVKHLFTSGEFPLTCVSSATVQGVGLLSARMQRDRWQAELAIEHHAQMVAVAAASVIAGGRVPMAFRSASNTVNSLWSADRGSLWGAPADDNLVLSASFGCDLPVGSNWTTEIEYLQREVGSRSSDLRTLFVIAVGNNGKDRPSTNFAYAGLPNVILVGGCEPQRGGAQWSASDATHGYTFTDRGSVRAVPDVCATTKGMTGGSVIHPVMAPRHVDERATAGLAVQGWVTGNGSSLSAPIVAGLAATLWELFPRVTAPQLKSAIVEGAAALHGGTFYWPDGIVPSEIGMNGARVHSREVSNSDPAKRAEFDGACRRLAIVDRDAAESVLYAPAGATVMMRPSLDDVGGQS